MDYEISITPGVPVAKRHQFEDRFDAFLERFDGEVTGGGGMIDGSASDLTFEANDDLSLDQLKSYLDASALAGSIKITDLDSGQEVLQFITEGKPWWKFW